MCHILRVKEKFKKLNDKQFQQDLSGNCSMQKNAMKLRMRDKKLYELVSDHLLKAAESDIDVIEFHDDLRSFR